MKITILTLFLLFLFTGFADNPLIGKIYFESDSNVLTEKEKNKIDSILQIIDTSQILNIQLHGYTDAEGSEVYNYQLSKKRANATEKYLVEKGLNADNIDVYYYGETQQSKGSPAENRMVRLVIYYQEKEEVKPFIRLNTFTVLPFDIDNDSTADLHGKFIGVGNGHGHYWKCTVRTVDGLDYKIKFHFEMKKGTFMEKGDTLTDFAEKRWGFSADLLKRPKGSRTWELIRQDISDRTEFYCGIKVFKTKPQIGWLHFRMVPQTGELILLNSYLTEETFLIVGGA